MAQYQHTSTSVTNGDATITLVAIDATSDLAVGDWFGINGDGIMTYQIGSIDAFGTVVAGATTLELTAPYLGVTGTGKTGIFQTGFTTPDGIPIPAHGDLELAEILGRSAQQIQDRLSEIEASPPRNWVINGDLQDNPVNQRGAATLTTTSSAYNYDRWYYDGTYLYYGVPAEDVKNDTYVLSWLTDNTAEWHPPSATASSGLAALTTGWVAVTSGDSFDVTGADGSTEHLWLRFTAGGDGLNALSKVKLEIGGTATTFEVEPYSEALRKCQRHVQIMGQGSAGMVANSTTIYWANITKSEMYGNPAASLRFTTLKILAPGAFQSTASSIAGTRSSPNGVRLTIDGFTGLTSGNAIVGNNATGADEVILEAEI